MSKVKPVIHNFCSKCMYTYGKPHYLTSLDLLNLAMMGRNSLNTSPPFMALIHMTASSSRGTKVSTVIYNFTHPHDHFEALVFEQICHLLKNTSVRRLLNGREEMTTCLPNVNPLVRILKHAGDDRSLQRDRLSAPSQRSCIPFRTVWCDEGLQVSEFMPMSCGS